VSAPRRDTIGEGPDADKPASHCDAPGEGPVAPLRRRARRVTAPVGASRLPRSSRTAPAQCPRGIGVAAAGGPTPSTTTPPRSAGSGEERSSAGRRRRPRAVPSAVLPEPVPAKCTDAAPYVGPVRALARDVKGDRSEGSVRSPVPQVVRRPAQVGEPAGDGQLRVPRGLGAAGNGTRCRRCEGPCLRSWRNDWGRRLDPSAGGGRRNRFRSRAPSPAPSRGHDRVDVPAWSEAFGPSPPAPERPPATGVPSPPKRGGEVSVAGNAAGRVVPARGGWSVTTRRDRDEGQGMMPLGRRPAASHAGRVGPAPSLARTRGTRVPHAHRKGRRRPPVLRPRPCP
jgi:hypothetical protein